MFYLTKLKFSRVFFSCIGIVLFVCTLLVARSVVAETPQLVVGPGSVSDPRLLVSSATSNLMLSFTLTAVGGDVTVNNISIERLWLGTDAAFSTVQVREFVTNQDIGKAKALNSLHRHDGRYTFVLPRGETRTYIVIADMANPLTSYAGETPRFGVVDIETDADVIGLPLVGDSRTINATLTIGSISMSQGSLDPGTAQTIPIGTTNKIFNSIRLDVGAAEPVALAYMIWEQEGTVGRDDLANLTTHVLYKGRTYSLPTYPYSVGSKPDHQWIALFDTEPIILEKGESAEIYITGDVVSGVGRTIDFGGFLKNAIYANGLNYGYELFGYTIHDNSAHTIGGASITISRADLINPSFQGSKKVGQLTFKTIGEPLTVESLGIDFESSVTNVRIWDSNNKLVAGPANTSKGSVILNPTGWVLPVGAASYTVTADSYVNFGTSITTVTRGVRTNTVRNGRF